MKKKKIYYIFAILILIITVLLFSCQLHTDADNPKILQSDLNKNEQNKNNSEFSESTVKLGNDTRGPAYCSKTLTYTVYESVYGKVNITIGYNGDFIKKGNVFYTNGSWCYNSFKIISYPNAHSGGNLSCGHTPNSGSSKYFEVYVNNDIVIEQTYSFIKDTGPTITLYPPKKWTNRNPAKVYIEIQDSLKGVIENSVIYHIKEEGIWKYPEEQLYEDEWAAYATRDGLSNITVKAKNKWGIVSTKSAQVWLDTKSPTIAFYPHKLWWLKPTSVLVYVYAEDYHSKVDDDSALYRINNGRWKKPEQVYDDEWEILITAKGLSKLTFKLRDNAGNWTTYTETIPN